MSSESHNPLSRTKVSFIIVALLIGLGLMGLRLWVSYPQLSVIYFQVIMKSSTYDVAKVYYDLGGGLSEKDSTEVQIIGDQRFHDYRFKIPQGVIGSFRFDPLTNQGSVTIKNIEIVSGFGKRIGSVDLGQLRPAHQIKKLDIRDDELTVITEEKANDPQISVSWRSLALSGYFSWTFFFFALRMLLEFLAIFFLSVCFFWLWLRRSDWMSRCLLVLVLIIFGWRCWILYEDVTTSFLNVSLQSSVEGQSQLYFNRGQGFSESDSVRLHIRPRSQYENYRFPLPPSTIYGFRFDPFSTSGTMLIKGMAIVDGSGKHLQTIDLRQLEPVNQIREFNIRNQELTIVTEREGDDPQVAITLFSPLMLDWKQSVLTKVFIGRVFFELIVIIAVVKLLFVLSQIISKYSPAVTTFLLKLQGLISSFTSRFFPNRYSAYLVEIILKAEARFNKHLTDRNICIFIISFSVLFSLILLKHNLEAKWSIIDDHEIMYYLGSDKNITLNEIPKLISQTEIASYGDSLRYRPSYYVLKIFETFLWKDNPRLWYAARILFLIIFLYVVSSIVTKQLGVFIAVPFTMFIMTGNYWPDILTRLGPSEICAVIGIALYAYGLYQIMNTLNSRKTQPIPWISFLIGGMIAIGSKENFVILAIPSFYLFLKLLVGRKNIIKLLLPMLHILFSVFISIGILLAIGKIGHDVYANEITLINRMHLISAGISQTIQDLKIPEIILILGYLFVVSLKSQGKKKIIQVIAQSRTILFLMSFLIFCYLFQIVCYSGLWPTNWRYDFPGILSKQLFWITCLILILEILNAIKNKPIIFVMRSIKISIVCFLIYGSMNSGFQHIINASKGNVWRTGNFTSKIQELSKLSSANPAYPIVIRSNNINDFEPVYSMEIYMNYLNIKNPLYLDYIDHDFNSRTGLLKQLTMSLTALSTKGSSTVHPIASLKDNTNCISVLLRDVPDNNECVVSIRF